MNILIDLFCSFINKIKLKIIVIFFFFNRNNLSRLSNHHSHNSHKSFILLLQDIQFNFHQYLSIDLLNKEGYLNCFTNFFINFLEFIITKEVFYLADNLFFHFIYIQLVIF